MRFYILLTLILAFAKTAHTNGPLSLIKDCGAIVKTSAGSSL